MANTLYDNARRLFALGEINWDTDVLHCFLVNANYTFNAAHTMLESIPTNARDYGTTEAAGVLMPAATNTVESNGAVNAAAVRFVTCEVGDPAVTAIVIARINTDPTDSELIYYADVATGLPITPNGGDIIVTWSTGTNKIFRL